MVAGIKPETYNVEVTGESAQIPKIYRQLLSFRDNGKITEEQIPTQYLKFTDKNGNDIINTGVEFDENNKFILTVAYEEVDGTIYEIVAPYYLDKNIPAIGDELMVRVDPTNAEQVYFDKSISEELKEKFVAIVLMIVCIMIIVGLF